jgi:hypothetical protein
MAGRVIPASRPLAHGSAGRTSSPHPSRAVGDATRTQHSRSSPTSRPRSTSMPSSATSACMIAASAQLRQLPPFHAFYRACHIGGNVRFACGIEGGISPEALDHPAQLVLMWLGIRRTAMPCCQRSCPAWPSPAASTGDAAAVPRGRVRAADHRNGRTPGHDAGIGRNQLLGSLAGPTTRDPSSLHRSHHLDAGRTELDASNSITRDSTSISVAPPRPLPRPREAGRDPGPASRCGGSGTAALSGSCP